MQALYLQDCYQREFASIVTKAEGRFTILEKTLFYPNSGGQPHDLGKMIDEEGNEYNVLFVKKINGEISHELDKEIAVGKKIKGIIDWQRRYFFMRNHTAAHVLSAVIHGEAGAEITGNQLGEQSRIDFSLENLDKDKIKSYEQKANEIIEQALPVETKFMLRSEAEKIPVVFKLAKGFPPEIKELRIVEIAGFDVQACGGTHVKNTKEIGKIEIIKTENKGKSNRRIYFRIIPSQ